MHNITFARDTVTSKDFLNEQDIMTTLGFYGSRRPSGTSSRTNTPTSAESDGVLNTKVDQLLSIVEKLQRDQRQLHQSIVTLTERVDCLCESTERLQAVQASESNSEDKKNCLPF